MGVVRAPSAGLPQPVTDFTVQRRGPRLLMHWTAPTRTSDGAAYRPEHWGALRYAVCAWPGRVRAAQASAPPPAPAAQPPFPVQIPSRRLVLPGAQGRFPATAGGILPPCPHWLPLSGSTLPLSALQVSGSLATLALAEQNGSGHMAGWSNLVLVPLTPVAPPPRLQSAVLTPQGVLLQWQLPQPQPEAILIYRQLGAAAPQLLVQVNGRRSSFVDRGIAWNRTYTYWLRSAAGAGAALAESAGSAHRSLSTHDVFPPPVPTGLQAVAAPGGGGVDLSWNPVQAPNLAGYNVWRRLPGQSRWYKRNSAPLLTPVFHDTLPPQSRGAAYAITAIGSNRNQSRRSSAVVVH